MLQQLGICHSHPEKHIVEWSVHIKVADYSPASSVDG